MKSTCDIANFYLLFRLKLSLSERRRAASFYNKNMSRIMQH